ncbi:hypothetical protein B7R54_15435 [Subtercola boreus]|uniref:DUF998 domain-containing protein n=1 Tax=Subtercola boreus TaxID=120213 RepID=A0A3E0VLU6_9MICO|nr:DUF998 domain-containing protein [Subtercola boreus]RFA10438.1 hypothetical protein B7R54_15435 [Subtercola boreus]TQL56035.1 uncharacterized protein DUF998 [Subtercola boreus]
MTTLAAIVALVGVAVALAALIVLHLGRPGLSPVRSAVGEYGISARRGRYRVATIALGVAAISLGVAVTFFLAAPNLLAFLFLLLSGVARLVISWAPMDAPGAPRTGTGRAHTVLAALFFASATVAAFLFTGSFVGDPVFGSIAGLSTGLAWAMAALGVFVVAAGLIPSLRRVFGLAERLLSAAILLWMTVVALAVLVR